MILGDANAPLTVFPFLNASNTPSGLAHAIPVPVGVHGSIRFGSHNPRSCGSRSPVSKTPGSRATKWSAVQITRARPLTQTQSLFKH